MIQEIKDPVLYREALRLATESLGVGPDVLQAEERAPARSGSSSRAGGRTDPQAEAGATVLSLILARPDLTAPLLSEGMQIRNLPAPLTLRSEDFRDETQARIFVLLDDHAGRDLDA